MRTMRLTAMRGDLGKIFNPPVETVGRTTKAQLSHTRRIDQHCGVIEDEELPA